MEYKDQLALLSQSILNFQDAPSEPLMDILEGAKSKGLKVYQRNLFFLVYNRLREDYPATALHLGEDNFRFIVRKYLLEKQIQDPDISQFSRSFVPYMELTFEFHQDALLSPLARLDRLYTFGPENEKCQVYQGVFLYWAQLMGGEESIHIDVDTSQLEEVFCLDVEGERCLKLGADEFERQ